MSFRDPASSPKEREQKMELYVWVDALRLTAKPKKHFARDFSDGVLVAEIVHQSRVARDNGVVVSMKMIAVKSFKGKMENWRNVKRKSAEKCGAEMRVDERGNERRGEMREGRRGKVLLKD